MVEKLARRLQEFMVGRNGVDSLARAMSVLALALIVVSLVVPGGLARSVVSWIALGCLGYCYFRMLSKNVSKRYRENCAWDRFARKALAPFRGVAQRAAVRAKYRSSHRVLSCPQCGQSLRVPKGKGKLRVSCPKCGSSFMAKS